jgi:hypothetical protein
VVVDPSALAQTLADLAGLDPEDFVAIVPAEATTSVRIRRAYAKDFVSAVQNETFAGRPLRPRIAPSQSRAN